MASPSLCDLVGSERKLVVGVGDLAVSSNQDMTLTTYSLGSCLGITIYDPVVRAGGLLHAMLPHSSINAVKAAAQPAMFVDTGLSALLRAAADVRIARHRMQICVVGGAQILDEKGFFNIGQRNYASLLELFRRHNLTIHAENVGGMTSRTIHLSLRSGEVRVRISGQRDETILIQG